MSRRLVLAVLALVLVTAAAAQQQEPPRVLDYPTMTEWLPQTPGTTAGAAGGFLNPAAWSTLEGTVQEGAFWWDDRSVRKGALDNWGFALSGPLGFGANSQVFDLGGDTFRVTDWQLGLSSGDRTSRLGLAYRWATGDNEALGRESALVAGWLWRPMRHMSFGAAGTWSTRSSSRQGVFDLGVRPFGDDRLSLYGDFTLSGRESWKDGRWGAGMAVRPVRGLHIGFGVRDLAGTDALRMHGYLGMTDEMLGIDLLGGSTDKGDHDERASYLVRFNPARLRNDSFLGISSLPHPFFAPLGLENRYLTYQKYRYLDTTRVAWLDVIRYLDAVEKDPACVGIALNLTDFRGRASLVWELRRRLESLQADGKEVVIVVGRLDMVGYYLASVADHLIMQPEGDLVLQGIASGRTYAKDFLEKLGLGFQELRYFKYKSAAETGARMDMSEGEREQRDRLVEVIYDEIRRGVCEARDLAPAEFDALVDDVVALSPERAVERGLVDALGGTEDALEWVRHARFCGFRPPYRGAMAGGMPEEQWSRPPRVAVVYAVGECAMDSGIKGRETARYLEALSRDRSVEAVVLRVDSPGGDPLPSEMVAAKVRKLRARGVPVIVSQGDVAASGGYWLSMDGEQVLTTPLTVTGSIGVIAAWIWAEELDEKLGLAYDGVQRGKHADLLRGLTMPGLGISVPYRGLDEGEESLFRGYILDAYDSFIEKVAAGRGLEEDAVRELARGRVWMGPDAVEHRLCDRTGGLTEAIALARESAGIKPGLEIELTEYPPRPLIDLSGLFGGGGLRLLPFGLLQPEDPWSMLTDLDASPAVGSPSDDAPFDYLRWYLQVVGRDMGRPQAVLPPEILPAGWGEPQ